jgi:hypothetical protein
MGRGAEDEGRMSAVSADISYRRGGRLARRVNGAKVETSPPKPISIITL